MELRFLGTTSDDGKCPTLQETPTGDIVVQGYSLTDPEALSQLRDAAWHYAVPRDEFAKRVPSPV